VWWGFSGSEEEGVEEEEGSIRKVIKSFHGDDDEDDEDENGNEERKLELDMLLRSG